MRVGMKIKVTIQCDDDDIADDDEDDDFNHAND